MGLISYIVHCCSVCAQINPHRFEPARAAAYFKNNENHIINLSFTRELFEGERKAPRLQIYTAPISGKGFRRRCS